MAQELGAAVSRTHDPTGAIVFVSGELADVPGDVAEALATSRLRLPLLVVGAAGVLSDQQDVESASAATAIVWGGGQAEAIAASAPTAHGPVTARSALTLLVQAIRRCPIQPASAVAVFTRPEGINPQSLEPLTELGCADTVFGAGTAGGVDLYALDADGGVTSGPSAAMLVAGPSRPFVAASAACRLLTPLFGITELQGPMVSKLDDEDALDVIVSVGQELDGSQPLLIALSGDPTATVGDGTELCYTAIRGIDPTRRGFLVSAPVHTGMRLAFAVPDGTAARQNLQRDTRRAHRAMAGAAPRFGLYLSCVGRGSSLHGSPNVERRILHSAFASVPIAGMLSSFEIAPVAGKPSLQLFNGVLALFTAPS